MALATRKPSELPEDAVVVSKEEALIYFTDIVQRWKIPSDVWALKYGSSILGAATIFSSIYINNYYRTMLRLGKYGAITSYLPIVVIPTVVATTYHGIFVAPKIILAKPTDCPMCIQIQSGVIQTLISIAYPSILAPISAFMYAHRHLTANVPSITEKPRSVFGIVKKMNKRMSNPILLLLALNLFLSSYIVYKEFDSVITINTKLAKLEEMLDESKDNGNESNSF